MRRRGGNRFHTEREATGYLALEIAARCLAAVERYHPGFASATEATIGAIRHDVPLDLLAALLMELARDAGKPCGCQPDADGDLYHYCKPTPADRAKAWIEKLQAGPTAIQPEDWTNDRSTPARLHG